MVDWPPGPGRAGAGNEPGMSNIAVCCRDRLPPLRCLRSGVNSRLD